MVLVGSVQWALGYFWKLCLNQSGQKYLTLHKSDWESHQYTLLFKTKCLPYSPCLSVVPKMPAATNSKYMEKEVLMEGQSGLNHLKLISLRCTILQKYMTIGMDTCLEPSQLSKQRVLSWDLTYLYENPLWHQPIRTDAGCKQAAHHLSHTGEWTSWILTTDIHKYPQMPNVHRDLTLILTHEKVLLRLLFLFY